MDAQPFAELPAALVDEILNKSSNKGASLVGSFNDLAKSRSSFRQALIERGLIRRDSELPNPRLGATICATDGAYALEKLLAADLVVAVAAAVEGLTPPDEPRHWPSPYHDSVVEVEPHHPDTNTILRTIMAGMEIMLAVRAPHDVILLDGSFTLPVIFFNQAFSKLGDLKAPQARGGAGQERFKLTCAEILHNRGFEFLEAYHQILTSTRSDRHYVALPKYSTRREVADEMQWPENFEDRGMLSMLLEGGELTQPIQLQAPDTPWHINTKYIKNGAKAVTLVNDIENRLNRVHAVYYKPKQEFPALRLEMAQSTASNDHQLGRVIGAISFQCQTPAILEPFPNYMADKMVKSLSRSMPAFRQIATQTIAERYEGDVGEVFFAMHGYRSETGRK